MAIKATKKTNKNIWIITIIVVIAILLLLKIIGKQPLTTQILSPAISPTKTGAAKYHSKFLKISVEIPPSYSVKESGNDITIKNNIGEISIIRIGTNNDSLDGYINGTETNSRLRNSEDKKRIIINGSPAYKINVVYLDYPKLNYRAYYFYKDYFIFNLQTNSPDLYPDLDQIARSFRYAP